MRLLELVTQIYNFFCKVQNSAQHTTEQWGLTMP